MKRAWAGTICIEGEQTGDGRFIVAGALEWAELPLPLGALSEEFHAGMFMTGGVQVGTIETITREGDEIRATGYFDDEIPEAAELIRRMEAGTAAHGDEVYVSVDPDNWDVEIIYSDAEDEGVILLASGEGQPFPFRERARTAAAGDGDPGEDGEVLWTESVDTIVERYTRLRIRGATVCSIPAFDRAIIRLTDEAATPAEEPAETDDSGGEEEDAEATTASLLTAAAIPVDPPSAWFADPQFGATPEEDPRLVRDPNTDVIGAPLTITDEGQVFGHLATWGSCHIGHRGVCVSPPHSSSGYAHFATGYVAPADCDCGPVPTGVITMGTGHADLTLNARDAAAHYDNTGTVVADVTMGEDEHGPWMAGALRPGVTPEQIRELRGSSPSGDWRSIGGRLELVAVLAVNVPGFPVPRAQSRVASGAQVALVAAGADRLVGARTPAQRRAVEDTGLAERIARLERVMAPVELEQLRNRVHAEAR